MGVAATASGVAAGRGVSKFDGFNVTGVGVGDGAANGTHPAASNATTGTHPKVDRMHALAVDSGSYGPLVSPHA
jgi:hypothetical protein